MDQPWEQFLTERDRTVFRAAGYGTSRGPAQRPVLAVIDVTVDFVGDAPEPILDSIERFPNSSGQEAWDAMEHLAPVLAAARRAGVPIVYTTNDPEHRRLEEASWGRKNERLDERAAEHGAAVAEIAAPVAPQPGDVVLRKTKPSAFFDTPLRQYMLMWQADTLVCCGGTTSGCVRATVVDAFSHGYAVQVLTDCTFDRGQASHAMSLFDMGQKYADLRTGTDFAADLARG